MKMAEKNTRKKRKIVIQACDNGKTVAQQKWPGGKNFQMEIKKKNGEKRTVK